MGLARKGLLRNGIGTRFSRLVNLRDSQDGSLRDWVFYGMGRNGSCGITWIRIFFYGMSRNGSCGITWTRIFFSFLILPEKNERESEKKAILVTFPPENIRSSGDDDSSSGDDDSRSGDDDSSSSDDDSSSGGVLIWFSLFYYT